MRAIKLFVLIVLLITICGFGFVSLHPEEDTLILFRNDGHLDSRETKKRFQKSMARTDIGKLYADVKQEAASLDLGKAHLAMHIFGETLYSKLRLDGVGVCDDSYGFGCYHGFFGTAIAREGIEILSGLDKACLDQYGALGLGCQHGIGHGLGEFYGPERINEQLDACNNLSWKGTFFGCSGGVFMEYNFPTVIEGDTAQAATRSFNADMPYEPCDRLSDRFRQSCYLELGTWYAEVFPNDWETLEKLCVNLLGNERKACFIGIGVGIAPKLFYDYEHSVNYCSHFDDTGEQLCLSGVAWSFFANPDHRSSSKSICAVAPDPTACDRDSNLIQSR